MISFEKALELILNQVDRLGVETISFEECRGRVLASDILCDRDVPAFNKSAMDGYACRREDLGKDLRVLEVIRAGEPPVREIGPGDCSQIMTGARIPAGADTVIKVEETEPAGPDQIRFTGEKTAANICYRAEDLRAGECILTAGTLMDTKHVPILATVGATFVDVYRLPVVGVLATGTELVEPGEVPGDARIRNSNAYQMIAQLGSMGIGADYYGIAPDDEEVTREMVAEALVQSDLVLLSGGVSMGEFDFVPRVLESAGLTIHFNRVAIQPGKPTLFASGQGKYVFGLPGNPVSSYFTFEMMVKPFLFAYMNHHWKPLTVRASLAQPVKRKKGERLGWIPVKFTPDHQVEVLEYHGSAHIFSLRDAAGILSMPLGVTEFNQGDWVDVRLI